MSPTTRASSPPPCSHVRARHGIAAQERHGNGLTTTRPSRLYHQLDPPRTSSPAAAAGRSTVELCSVFPSHMKPMMKPHQDKDDFDGHSRF
uniref:Uncharacterized protein n=1 Tax=Arundo donax TaxID=35708 RepID=A0A0A9H9W9_ARUDO